MKVTFVQRETPVAEFSEFTEGEPTQAQLSKLAKLLSEANVPCGLGEHGIVCKQEFSRDLMALVVRALAAVFVEFELIDKINQPVEAGRARSDSMFVASSPFSFAKIIISLDNLIILCYY